MPHNNSMQRTALRAAADAGQIRIGHRDIPIVRGTDSEELMETTATTRGPDESQGH
jgi:hypothetical protein